MLRKYLPLILFLLFSGVTILLFYFGPIHYNITNEFVLISYLFLVHLFIITGFIIGTRIKVNLRGFRMNYIRNLFFFMKFLVLINLILNILLFLEYGLNPVSGVIAAGEARESWDLKSGTILSYLTNWTEISNIPLIGMGIMLWKYLGRSTRYLIIGAVLFQFILSVSIGARHWLYIVFFLTTFSLLYGRVAGIFNFSLWKFLLNSFLMIIPILFFFTVVTLARSGVSYSLNQNVLQFEDVPVERFALLDLGEFDSENFLLNFTPTVIQPLVIQGISYFTHGYYGLSICLNKSFRGIGFGLGQSAFGNRLAEKYIGKEFINEVSYPLRIMAEDNYPTTNWITSYSWLASDFTFLGTFVYLFLLSVMFGHSWKSYLLNYDFHAAIVVTLISTLFLNMPLIFGLQDPPSFVTFYLVLWAYVFRMRNNSYGN